MELIRDIATLRAWCRERRSRRRALVPTMGALHEGHLRLVDRALREASAGGDVVVSLFVNPVQFGPGEDLERYPRTLESDLEACRRRGVRAVFAPATEEMYAPDRSVTVSESRLSASLCGASRPGHFDGVCTVVAKLFHLVLPDVAVFGEKDYQQLAVIRRMVRDLDFPVEIAGEPTVREPDGLAMSSRNAYLTGEERGQAPTLHRALCRADGAADVAEALARARAELAAAPLARLDYLEAVQPETLEPLPAEATGPARILVAAFFGRTRLIDNRGVTLGGSTDRRSTR